MKSIRVTTISIICSLMIIFALLAMDSNGVSAVKLRKSRSTCNSACTMDNTPVCAAWGRSFKFQTFPNRCAFDSARCKERTWTYVHSGECRKFRQVSK